MTEREIELAAQQARQIIHDNDVERLKHLLAECPALLSWRSDEAPGGLLQMATEAYGDAGDEQRERWFTRAASAEVLIDAGASVAPSITRGILDSRARGLLQLFDRKGLLPRTLPFLTALGDLDAVRTALDNNGENLATVNEAFMCACRFRHDSVALLLLDRSIALDPDLGGRIDVSVGRRGFVARFIGSGRSRPTAAGLWIAFVMEQVSRAAHDGDLDAFVSGFHGEPRLLGDEYADLQNDLIGAAILNDRGAILAALLDLDPAILRHQPPPPSQAIEFAFTYAKTHLLPLLTRIWPIPDDLPHAAGIGDLSRVEQWFDNDGTPLLGEIANHAPATSVHPREPQWGKVGVQQVLDTALAYSVINRHFDAADFLLAHGANINTTWNSHEPASILHHLVFLPNPYESMRFLVDRGIDMTVKDYRWSSTAIGWARYGNHNEDMAAWLEQVERQREIRRRT